MAGDLRRPAELLNELLGAIRGTTIETVGGYSFRVPEIVRNRIRGDCDEVGVLASAGISVIGIESALRLAGHWQPNEETGAPELILHHVWGLAQLDGGPTVLDGVAWWDMDATIKRFRFGEYAPFPQYVTRFIYRETPEG